jgi:hypothetical protein
MGNEMQRYAKQVERSLDSAIPWKRKAPGRSEMERLRGRVKSGEVVVFLDEGESPDDPMFKGAKISRK